MSPTPLRTLPSEPMIDAGLEPTDAVEEYHRRGFDELDDATFLDAVAAVVATPRAGTPESFVLHAPLELLARATLLRHCSPARRTAARQRLLWTAARYQRADAPATEPRGPQPRDVDDALQRLGAAVAAGELDDAWLAGSWLGREIDPTRLPGLVGDEVVPALAAAAHGPIFLHLLPRLGVSGPAVGSMFGALARELARPHPQPRLRWVEDRPAPTGAAVAEAIAAAPVLGVPGSSSIQPIMEQAEGAARAAELLGPVLGGDPYRTTCDLLRLATESMLLDDPAVAPYGWSHCLTMPLAVTAIAPMLRDPDAALAVAATHVLGFRSALGRAPLEELRGQEPVRPGDHFRLDDRPEVTAATLRHAPSDGLPHMVRHVVDYAVVHPDAHLAKYVVACVETARVDPSHARQHLAAAAYLASWWSDRPGDQDDLLSQVGATPSTP